MAFSNPSFLHPDSPIPGLAMRNPNAHSVSDSQSLGSEFPTFPWSIPETRADNNGPVGNGVSLVRGIPKPDFKIQGHGIQFSGSLKIQDELFVSNEIKPNHKEVKKELAGFALEFLRRTPVESSSRAAATSAGNSRDGRFGTSGTPGDSDAGQERNWIGDLDRLYVHASQKPVFSYEKVDKGQSSNPRHRYTVTLSTRPDHPFGSLTDEYLSKKAAKTAAAKQAMLWLERSGNAATLISSTTIMKSKQPIGIFSEASSAGSYGSKNPIGSGRSSDSASTSASAAASTSSSSPGTTGNENGSIGGEGEEVEMTNRELVHYLCTELGFSNPKYRITSVENQPELVSCVADFTGEPELEDPLGIGRVDGVFGERKAKDECARNVIAILLENRATKAAQFGSLEAIVKQ